MLGGLIAVSIGASITTRYLTYHLAEVIPLERLDLIMQRTDQIYMLQPNIAVIVRQIFGRAYNLQMYLATGFAAAQLPATALMWTWKDYVPQVREKPLEKLSPNVDESLG